jgi:hypothetical protein
MDWMSLIGLVTQVGGAALGSAVSGMDRAKALQLIQQSYDAAGNLDVPRLQKLVASTQGPSAYNDIKEDPEFRSQQASSDRALQDVVDSGGLTLADKAALNVIRNKIARTAAAGNQSIEANMARRGTLDSGAQLAMQLANNQSAAQNASEAGEFTAGQAQQRALDALRQRWSNANTAGNQDYERQSRRAQANDAIARANADILNTTNRYNQQLPVQQQSLQLGKLNAVNQAGGNLAGAYGQQAQNTQDLYAGVGKGAGQAISAYGQDQSDKEAAAAWRREQERKRGNADNSVNYA